MSAVRYRIWYDDPDLTYDNLMGPPWEAPKFGAQVIGQVNRADGWRHHRSGDYFVYREDKGLWFPATTDGLEDHFLFFARFVSAVIKGRQLTDEEFNEIKRQAVLDPDLPVPSECTR